MPKLLRGFSKHQFLILIKIRRLKLLIFGCLVLFLACLVFVLQLFALYILVIRDNCNTF
jgi:hypothetical protein